MHFLRRQGKINIFLMRILYLRNSFFSGMIRLSSFLNTETEMSLKNEALLTPRHWTYREDKKSPTLISSSWNVIYPAQKGVTLTHFYVGVFRCCEASGTVKEQRITQWSLKSLLHGPSAICARNKKCFPHHLLFAGMGSHILPLLMSRNVDLLLLTTVCYKKHSLKEQFTPKTCKLQP